MRSKRGIWYAYSLEKIIRQPKYRLKRANDGWRSQFFQADLAGSLSAIQTQAEENVKERTGEHQHPADGCREKPVASVGSNQGHARASHRTFPPGSADSLKKDGCVFEDF